MANHYSALKRVRQEERRTQVNRMRKTRLRHAIRSLRRAVQANNVDAATKLLPATFSAVDKAAKTGIIKKNTAARYKSRLSRRVRALSAPVAA